MEHPVRIRIQTVSFGRRPDEIRNGTLESLLAKEVLPCELVGRLQRPQGFEGTGLGISLESENEFEQLRYKVIVPLLFAHQFPGAAGKGFRL